MEKEYNVTLTLKITTSGGEDMAKRIFSNLVKSDSEHPLRNLTVTSVEHGKR